MYYDINNIDLSKISLIKENINEEKNEFNYNVYNSFKSSYINNCDDQLVIKMKFNLNNMYEKISNGYENIYNWLNDYILSVTTLEESLTNNSNLVSNYELNNYINNKLMNLPSSTVFDELFNMKVSKLANDSSDASNV